MKRAAFILFLFLISIVVHGSNVSSRSGVVDHGALTGLSDDDHAQYCILVGRSPAQNIIGGTSNGQDLDLESTSAGTKGAVNIVAGSEFVVISGNNRVSDGQLYSVQEDLAGTGSGTTDTIDWDLGNAQVIDLNDYSGDVTLTLVNPNAGASYIVKVIQQAVATDVVWPAAVLWQGGTAPVITTDDNAVDVISCYYDGADYLCNFGQDFK